MQKERMKVEVQQAVDRGAILLLSAYAASRDDLDPEVAVLLD